MMTLKDALEGKEYLVQKIDTDDEELNAFLFSLGCYTGEPITVVSHLKGGCVVSIKDGRYNIDNQLAAANGVVGLNYYPTQYESKHNQQPTWPLVGTETASPANSRGIYNTLSSSSQLGDYQCTQPWNLQYTVILFSAW